MTTLVYIGGLSRSGSTLLELALATHRTVSTVGELQIWPHELRGTDVTIPCGCGESVASCPFWMGVRRRVDPLAQPAPRLDHFREWHQWGATLRPSVWRDFVDRSVSSARADAMRTYGENTRDVVETAADQYGEDTGTRPTVVVDASKDPYRALWLARSGAVELRLIHLTRDPRAVVHSLTRDETPPSRRRLHATRRSFAWTIENLLLDQVRGRYLATDQSIVLRYEALATDPSGVLSELAAFCGVPTEIDVADRVPSTSVHSIAGNPMRHDRQPIALDTRWRTEADPFVQRVAWRMTGPERRRHGYRAPDDGAARTPLPGS